VCISLVYAELHGVSTVPPRGWDCPDHSSGSERSDQSRHRDDSTLATIPYRDLTARGYDGEAIGHGAAGVVFTALWRGDTAVAVKKKRGVSSSDAAAVDNERQLVRTLARLPHANVVTVFGVCVDAPDGDLRIVMELCELGSLEDFLREPRQVRQ
jgi:hypothetical protein